MMRSFFLSLIVMTITLAGFNAHAQTQNEAITAESNIIAATVYTNRAKVERKAVVNVPKGAHKIVFKDLPPSLMGDSLRAQGSAVQQVVIGALSHKRVITKELSDERQRALNEKLETLNDKVKIVQAESQALQAQKAFIQNIGKQAGLRTDEEIAKLTLNAGEWGPASEVIHTSLAAVLKQEVALDIKMRDLQKEIRQTRDELRQLGAAQRDSYEVSIPVEAAGATELTLTLSYQVPNATWHPIYDARLGTENETLELIQYGAVRQSTGEDWTDVALTLSTAQPHRGASLPPLRPNWINIWEPSKQKRSRVMMESAASAPLGAVNFSAGADYGMADEIAVQAPKKATFAMAQIQTGGFVSEYIIAGPSDVPSDGTDTKLMVGAFKTDSALEVHVQPQQSSDAFLVSRTTLKGEAPVLPGKANLFRDGAFVGQTNLPMLRPEEKHDLFFGVDDQISVKRKVMKDERKDAGIISRDNELTRHYLTEIKNLHKQQITIVVKETIPVAQNEDIEIKLDDKITTEGYMRDADKIKGVMRWSFDLKPAAEQDINLGYTVSWPKDHNLSGL